jgi:hypothetical protein
MTLANLAASCGLSEVGLGVSISNIFSLKEYWGIMLARPLKKVKGREKSI